MIIYDVKFNILKEHIRFDFKVKERVVKCSNILALYAFSSILVIS